ncbi:hypothetical protein ACSBR2_040476 [Camellia fascicularis]
MLSEWDISSFWGRARFKYMERLPKIVSNHCPILLLKDERDWGPKPFRFLNAWTVNPTFSKVVRKVKQALKRWNNDVFGVISVKLQRAEEKLHEFDLVAKTRELSNVEKLSRREIRDEVWKLSKMQEWIWLQKSRLNWVQKGDKNTRFFHVIASCRQNRNGIGSLNFGGIVYDEPVRIKQEYGAVDQNWPVVSNQLATQ